MTLKSRINKLEQNKPTVAPFADLILRDYGEPIADAAKRQGIDYDESLNYLVVTFVAVGDLDNEKKGVTDDIA